MRLFIPTPNDTILNLSDGKSTQWQAHVCVLGTCSGQVKPAYDPMWDLYTRNAFLVAALQPYVLQ
jgi:hypothetical protein